MMNEFFYPDVWVRVPLYMMFGLIMEVLFTGITDLVSPKFLQSWHVMGFEKSAFGGKRNVKAVSYTFLWMLPIYALLVFFEPVTILLKEWPLWLRGFIYLPSIWLTEYITGWVIQKLTGECPWDYSYAKYSFHGLIRWDFAPFWYAMGVFLDGWVIPKFVALTPAIKAVF
jgi:uncharacterized membrane protein